MGIRFSEYNRNGKHENYLVPHVEEEEYYFLKTVIPNREAKKKYMEDENG